MKRTIMCMVICFGLAGCRPAAPNKPEPTTPPMRYPDAIFIVTYTGPVKTAFTSSVTQSWSQAEGQPVRYRSTMMQCQHNGEPPSPGRVQWEFAGTVMEGDVYIVRIHPDMTATNATILPIIYSGTPLNVFNDGTLEIRLATTGLASMARTDDPVLSVNTNRILSLARQAVAESRGDVELGEVEFTDITYRLDAEQKETLRVGFRHSPESDVTNDEHKGTVRTMMTFQAITVEMDRNGEILSVSKGGTSRQIRVESHTKHKAQRQNARKISAILASDPGR